MRFLLLTHANNSMEAWISNYIHMEMVWLLIHAQMSPLQQSGTHWIIEGSLTTQQRTFSSSPKS